MSYFITFEGVEGCGKTTQIKLLKEFLEENSTCEIVLTREPGGTPLANKIREILLSRENKALTAKAELLLYEASRNQHVEELIKPALKAKKTVLCDRYMDATTVYQGIARGLGVELCEKLNNLAVGECVPHLTLVLDCPPEIGLKRSCERLSQEKSKESRFEEEKLEFHKKVHKGYRDLAKKYPARMKLIDARGTIDDIQQAIQKEVKGLLKKCFRK